MNKKYKQRNFMGEIEQILDFLIEVEKLKSVLRQTRPVGINRRENSAEHSWHVCLAALALKDYANEEVDIDRVIKMLLIHDLGEIDADDKIIYFAETDKQKANEKQGIERLLAKLPDGLKAECLHLWQEFEAGETAESRFARAIDRVPPLLQNCHNEGHTWKEYEISKSQVFSLNSRIGAGSKELWGVIKGKLDSAVEKGFLK
ncbi:HD domain-containing protein [Microbulbifer sp. VTAC004]|uniref:HD domain-containing protein n=1 Tax=unclassified Microbulbifer TaxID=2619833 RepID=UPI0040393C90